MPTIRQEDNGSIQEEAFASVQGQDNESIQEEEAFARQEKPMLTQKVPTYSQV